MSVAAVTPRLHRIARTRLTLPGPWQLWALIALAALVRFPTLGQQSYWYDEEATVGLLRLPLKEMLPAATVSESTPPLYYILAWCWSRVFSLSEVGLRSLSAVAGLLTVPAAYAGVRELASRRAALIAAALTATSPLLVWYSQDGRSYALFALFATASFWAFARALRTRRGIDIALWGASCTLALITHYFALFVTGMEAAVLLASASGARRWVVLASAQAGLTFVALSPAFAVQSSSSGLSYIVREPLRERILELPRAFADGVSPPPWHLAIPTLVLSLTAIAFAIVRGDRDTRRAAGVVLGVGAGATVVALAVAHRFFLARNNIGAWYPLAIASSLGFALHRSRLGLAAAAAVCVMGLAVVAADNFDARLQKPDWRGVAALIGRPHGDRLVVVGNDVTTPLRSYLPGTEFVDPRTVLGPQAEVVVISEHPLRRTMCWARAVCNTSPPSPTRLPDPHWRLVETRERQGFSVARFRAARPLVVDRAGLLSSLHAYGVYLQRDVRR